MVVPALESPRFIAGALCLDFANTAGLGARGGRSGGDSGMDFAALVAWFQAAEVMADQAVKQLGTMAAADPVAAERTAARALALRDALWGVFVPVATGVQAPAAALDRLNAFIGPAYRHLRLIAAGDGFVLDWPLDAAGLDSVLWPLARSAVELLTTADPDRIKQCQGRACGWLFVDDTKNGRRRWCEMEVCGNREKARRHYHRQKAVQV